MKKEKIKLATSWHKFKKGFLNINMQIRKQEHLNRHKAVLDSRG